MKRFIVLMLALVSLFSFAKADYVQVKTDAFKDFAGISDDEAFKKLGKTLSGALGIYIGYEFENSNTYNFMISWTDPFALGIGTSRLDNGFWYMVRNKKTGEYRIGYIDFDDGKMYVENFEQSIDDAVTTFSFNTDNGYVYSGSDLKDIVEYLNQQ